MSNEWYMNNKVIAILGGMGSYATAYIFKAILDIFPAEKEWDRPRLVIDNYCTLPSRVRAILYNDKKEILINGMEQALLNLMNYNPDYIIIPCNTAHYFLPELKSRISKLDNKIIELPKLVEEYCNKHKIKNASLLASEGTITAGIYEKTNCLNIVNPDDKTLSILRHFIENAKKGEIKQSEREKFTLYINSLPQTNIILGCTEFSIFNSKCSDLFTGKNIIDPLELLLKKLKRDCK